LDGATIRKIAGVVPLQSLEPGIDRPSDDAITLFNILRRQLKEAQASFGDLREKFQGRPIEHPIIDVPLQRIERILASMHETD